MEMEELINQPELKTEIEHPQHYTFSKYEVLDVVQEWFPADPLLWQVCKYIARAAHKGHTLKDLYKAEFYLKARILKQRQLEFEKDMAGLVDIGG